MSDLSIHTIAYSCLLIGWQCCSLVDHDLMNKKGCVRFSQIVCYRFSRHRWFSCKKRDYAQFSSLTNSII